MKICKQLDKLQRFKVLLFIMHDGKWLNIKFQFSLKVKQYTKIRCMRVRGTFEYLSNGARVLSIGLLVSKISAIKISSFLALKPICGGPCGPIVSNQSSKDSLDRDLSKKLCWAKIHTQLLSLFALGQFDPKTRLRSFSEARMRVNKVVLLKQK